LHNEINDETDYYSEEMHVVLSADTIIDIFAVMIEFLYAPIASFTVIAVFMDFYSTAIAPYE